MSSLLASLEQPGGARPPAPFVPLAHKPAPRPRREAAAQGATRGHVLVVDDEPDILASLVGLLEDELPNVRVTAAGSGQEALGVLAQHAVDLVVSDFRMPGMDGLALLSHVRANWPSTPTVLVSAYADEGLARRAEAGGDVGLFLPKPLPLDTFVEAVERFLG